MLLEFKVQNWMSFRDEATMSMLATPERQHGERVAVVPKYKLRVLPVAAVYGGNASGKTNLFKAINFAKRLVTRGTRVGAPIAVDPFRLDDSAISSPSVFTFTILVKAIAYRFNFAVTRKAVVEEKLVRLSAASEKELYHRKHDGISFAPHLQNQDFLEFAFQGTRPNQLFLTNAVMQNVDEFRDVYEWFDDNLVLIAPGSRFLSPAQLFSDNSPFFDAMTDLLRSLDTGIGRLGSEEVSLERYGLPEPLMESIHEVMDKAGTGSLVIEGPQRDYLMLSKDADGPTAKKLVTYHADKDRREVKFDLRQESDGSKRLINLLPAFIDLMRDGADKVYMIDEIDRSLHTIVTQQLLGFYLSGCSRDTRAQLLLTTHDLLLMDQKIFRRDEMWVTERESSGASRLYSFSEFSDVRYDKDIRKSYLQGRLGGVPRIMPYQKSGRPSPPDGTEEDG